MFSKLSTFRIKGTTRQRGKEKAVASSKSNASPRSAFTAGRTTSDIASVRLVSSQSGASSSATNASDGNSSPVSFEENSTYNSKESLTTSSIISEEIISRPSVLLPFEDAEEQFLQMHEGYFLHLSVDNMRKEQYPELELQRLVYLDYATSPLFSRHQVEKHMQILLEEAGPDLVSNAIPDNPNQMGNSYINSTYAHILNILNTNQSDYSIIFTPGLASCYRIFGTMYHLQKGSVLLVGHDDHKAVQHMLHETVRCNARKEVIPFNKDLSIQKNDMRILLRKQGWRGQGCGLFVYPLQSCSSGVRHSLNWIVDAQENGWKVLIDVSSCLPMLRVDLSLYQPEFVIGSLYHMLGYPCDVGFILIRRGSFSLCTEKGSKDLKIVEVPEVRIVAPVVMECESLNVHTLAALTFGLEHLESIGHTAIQKRTESLAAWLINTLKSLRHKFDGRPLLKLYGSLDKKYRGSVLTFHVLDPTGHIFPPRLVQRLAKRENIFLGVSSINVSDLVSIPHHKPEKQSSNLKDHASSHGLPVIRLSLGPVSTFNDVYSLANFLSCFRDEDYMSSVAAGYVEEVVSEC